ncbi:MAG: UDP-N-acetylmuramoyl-L-alanyl-D-glutamate--2,6-diaminopimelate ligase, partial [Deltaproteobacteria bacterium]|nr:UDP-N-acetylmuramoyl-L-alanyl-D-glutamate--2,6-diaminopimelate ligase [Deltaproteobacteria bacterium]
AAVAAREVWGRPDEALTTAGLTGTNGKTTTAYLLEAALTEAGLKVGVMGTVDYRWPGTTLEAPNTTPDGPRLFRALAAMRQAGCQAAILEVSSHALDLGRLGEMSFRAALFTNLTRDHLDHHGDMEAYYQAKRRLFTERLRPGPGGRPSAAVNLDDPYGARLAAELGDQAIGFGFGPRCRIRGTGLALSRRGLTLDVEGPWGRRRLSSPLLGRFNASNLLGALALLETLSIDPDVSFAALSRANGAPGRLERVGARDEYLTLVDYAHTPEALAALLASIRALAPRRLLCVFGCGGDRDRGKRPLMGREAGRLADLCLLTSDNPRTEDPWRIIEETARGLAETGLRPVRAQDGRLPAEELHDGRPAQGIFVVEPDRERAIQLAAALLEPGDALAVAGKGHEAYQIVGRDKRRFDDRERALAALSAAGKA